MWAPSGRELFYRTATHLVAASLALGAELALTRRDTLFADSFVRGAINYDVFPNGREFVMIRESAGAARVSVVINWQALLKKP